MDTVRSLGAVNRTVVKSSVIRDSVRCITSRF